MTDADIFKLWCEATDALLEVEVERDGDDVVVSRVHHYPKGYGSEFGLEPLWRCKLSESGQALARVHGVTYGSDPKNEADHERMLESFWLTLGVAS